MNKPKEFLLQWILTFGDRWVNDNERCDEPWYAKEAGFSVWSRQVKSYFENRQFAPGRPVRINQAGLDFIKEK